MNVTIYPGRPSGVNFEAASVVKNIAGATVQYCDTEDPFVSEGSIAVGASQTLSGTYFFVTPATALLSYTDLGPTTDAQIATLGERIGAEEEARADADEALGARTDSLESDRQKVHARPSIQYVDEGGSDANDGKSWGKPKLTMAAAHSALGSDGGTINVAGNVAEAGAVTITKCVRLIGLGAGVQPNASEAVLRFAAGVSGLVFSASAQKSRVQDLDIASASSGAGSDKGLTIKTHGIVIDNVCITDFGSHGVHIDSSGGDNANCFDLRSVRVFGARGDGFKIQGNDSNAGTLYMCDASGCTGWGFNNASFGNIFILPQCENNTAGAVKDTGSSNWWQWPYVEGVPSTGQNVDLSAAADYRWDGQTFGHATFTPAPAFGGTITHGRAVEKYMKLRNTIDGAAQTEWLLADGSYAPDALSLTDQTRGRNIFNVNSEAAVATRFQFNVPVDFVPRTAASVTGPALFVDSADGKLKWKDSGGTTNALY